MSTKAGKKTEIAYAGLEEQVMDWLYKDKMTHKQICDKLRYEHNIDLGEASISNFKKSMQKEAEGFLRQDKEYREKLARRLLDGVENLAFALEKIKARIADFDDPETWRQQATFLTLLLQECQMILRRTGEIKPNQFIEKVEMNFNQINNIVQLELVKVIEDEFIKDGKVDVDKIMEFLKKRKENAILA